MERESDSRRIDGLWKNVNEKLNQDIWGLVLGSCDPILQIWCNLHFTSILKKTYKRDFLMSEPRNWCIYMLSLENVKKFFEIKYLRYNSRNIIGGFRLQSSVFYDR